MQTRSRRQNLLEPAETQRVAYNSVQASRRLFESTGQVLLPTHQSRRKVAPKSRNTHKSRERKRKETEPPEVIRDDDVYGARTEQRIAQYSREVKEEPVDLTDLFDLEKIDLNPLRGVEEEDVIVRFDELNVRRNGPKDDGKHCLMESDDDYLLPGFIDDYGTAREFSHRRAEDFMESTLTHKDAEDNEFHRAEHNRQVIVGQLAECNPCRSGDATAFTCHFLEEGIGRKPFVKMLRLFDSNAYFNYMAANIVHDCVKTPECVCIKDSACSLNMNTFALNPLHLAASFGNPKFFSDILNNDVIESKFVPLIRDKYNWKQILAHYHAITMDWLNHFGASCRATPLEMAAELGNIPNVREILRSSKRQELLVFYAQFQQSVSKTKPRLCVVNQCFFMESLLSRLLETKTLEELNSQDYFDVINWMRKDQVPYAITVAMEQGNTNAMDDIWQHWNTDNSLLTDKWEWTDAAKEFTPLKNDRTTTMPPPPSHVLARNGHYEQFSGLGTRQFAVDLIKESALPLLLGFTDEQVTSLVTSFRHVRREDLFLYVTEVILKKRRNLLHDALQMAMTNPDNFIPKRLEGPYSYVAHGLPYYTVLPLETALIRLGDMDVVDVIILCYSRQGMYAPALKMIQEDCFRCLEVIQDIADRITDQSRLALILIMLPFLDVFSKRFKGLINMHSGRSDGFEHIGNFVVANYATRRSEPYKKCMTFVPCKDAMNDAGEAVMTWNGSLETCGTVPVIPTRDRYVNNRLNPLKSIKKPKKENRERFEEATEIERLTQKIAEITMRPYG